MQWGVVWVGAGPGKPRPHGAAGRLRWPCRPSAAASKEEDSRRFGAGPHSLFRAGPLCIFSADVFSAILSAGVFSAGPDSAYDVMTPAPSVRDPRAPRP
ncbi:hypothetical protein SNL152K_5843 [Streptomyces sp. NL15-2K]|nr:hypothetical protein SNL152K_5843 [Streptomyces sp. NL15-2K]